MRKIVLLLILASLLAACAQPTPAPSPTPQPEPTVTSKPVTETGAEESGDLETQAKAFVDLLADGNFEAAVELFDDTMKTALPADQLQQIWLDLNTSVGVYGQQLGTRMEEQGAFQIVYVICQFGETVLDAKVVFDQAGQIAGLFFAPTLGLDDESRLYSIPDYANLDGIEEVEVVVGSGDWELPGTLTLPLTDDAPFPAVVLVHGSGASDRDESIGPNKPFQDLAWGLASQGVAVLRYDKRTLVYAEALASMEDITVQAESIDDALAAVTLLREDERIDPDRIFVVGHSLGGMLAPRIAAADPNIAGIVVMAGNTRPLEDVILAQVRYLFELNGSLSESEQQQLMILEQQVNSVKAPDLSDKTPKAALPLGVPASYWLDLRDYDPAATAAALSVPVLVLQGGRDYQVTAEEDYPGWQDALATHENADLRLYLGLNHLFMELADVEDEAKASPDEYERPGNVASYVIDDIANWVQEH